MLKIRIFSNLRNFRNILELMEFREQSYVLHFATCFFLKISCGTDRLTYHKWACICIVMSRRGKFKEKVFLEAIVRSAQKKGFVCEIIGFCTHSVLPAVRVGLHQLRLIKMPF